MYTVEPLVPEPSYFKFKNASEKLRRHELRGTYQIQAEMIQVEDRTLHSEIHKLFIQLEISNKCQNKERKLFSCQVLGQVACYRLTFSSHLFTGHWIDLWPLG